MRGTVQGGRSPGSDYQLLQGRPQQGFTPAAFYHDFRGTGPMLYLDRTLPSAAENLALDEALLLEAEAGRGGEVLRVWEWPELAVVLGSGCRLAEDVDESAC